MKFVLSIISPRTNPPCHLSHPLELTTEVTLVIHAQEAVISIPCDERMVTGSPIIVQVSIDAPVEVVPLKEAPEDEPVPLRLDPVNA